MARVSVTTQTITRAGLTPSLTAPTVDNDVIDTGDVFLQVTNAAGAPINVTVQSPPTVDGLAVAELIVAVPNGQTRLIGPFPSRTFGQPSGADAGRAYVDYSAVTSITRGVFTV